MRTDSVNLSSLAIATAKDEIVSQFGEAYHKARRYRTSTKGAQEAHEAIRPTYMSVRTAGDTADEKRLYELIWKRTLACQMADAETRNTRIEIAADGIPYLFVANGEVVVFDGFMRVYIQSTDDETEQTGSVLPQMKEGAELAKVQVEAQETFTRAPFRYTEASLVKRMEELGIGRPSTYATIIETIQNRHYVERGNVQGRKRDYNVLTLKSGHLSDRTRTETYGHDTQKLLPTDLGRITNDFLVAQFPDILSYDFTAKEEENFDDIAAGKVDWVHTVDDFYRTFHPAVKQVPAGKVAGRLLGADPVSGAPVYAKISRIGPCVQIGDAEVDKPRFTSIPKGVSLFSITLDQALALFRDAQPKVLMRIDGNDVVAGEGKYGPYIKFDGQYLSVPKGTDPAAMTEDEVRALIENHRLRLEPLKEWGDMQVLQGRYGPYIKTPQGNFRIPKNVVAESLTEEDCHRIVQSASAVPSRSYRHKK
jgi:DNA topoisomerase-1